MKGVKIYVENPNFRQRFIVVTANFLLWYIAWAFSGDDEKFEKETSEVLTEAYKAIRDAS